MARVGLNGTKAIPLIQLECLVRLALSKFSECCLPLGRKFSPACLVVIFPFTKATLGGKRFIRACTAIS